MKNNKLYRIVIYALLIINTLSCKEDDFSNIKELKVYIPAIGSSYNVINGNVVVLRNEMLVGNDLKFPVLATRPFSEKVEVEAIIDTTLISDYDSLYNKQSPSIPDGLFTLLNNSVTINAGQTISKDSICISVDANKQVNTGSFVIPIVINTVNSPVPTSTKRNVMYLNATFAKVESSVGLTTTNRTSISTVNYTPVGTTGPDKLNFTGFLSQPIPKSATITVSLAESSAVDAYNEKNNTNYLNFPTGAYNLSKKIVTVPADATMALDNFEVTISDLTAFKKDCSYLLVLSIDNEGIVESDDDANLMYLVMNSSFSNIDMSKTSEPETMLDRSGWTIASYGSSYYGSASSVLDDKYSTSWLTSADGANITIDMGANQSLNGIQLAPNYKYSVKYNASSFEIATSNDNSTWTTQGTYSGETFGGDAYTPDLRNIHFYAPVDARYFRITFDKNTSSSYLAGASEIRGF